MSTVPIFAPDGTLGDVPYEHMKEAIAAGGKPGVTVKAPDGSLGVIPADRTQDAVKAGGSIVPIQQQETQHPGFWANIADDLKGLLHPSGFSPYPGMDQEAKSAAATQAAQQDQSRKDAGYPLPYRALAPVAQSVGVNVPGMEESAAQGDVAGVAGHAAAPVAALATGEAAAHLAAPAADAALDVAKNLADHPLTKAIYKTVDTATFDRIGKIWNAWKNLPEEIRARGPQFHDPGAPLPEAPPKELLQARSIGEGAKPGSSPSDALGNVPQRYNPATAPAAAPTPQASSEGVPEPMSTVNGSTIPRTLSGDSALRQVLTGQDNANLLKIAKSRGINVTRESQLKPGTADNLIINKIINDFAPEELDEIGSQYLENSRFRHAFGDIGPTAWKTMSLQTYFPDLKIPATQAARTRTAIENAGDLTDVLQQSLKAAKKQKESLIPATARP